MVENGSEERLGEGGGQLDRTPSNKTPKMSAKGARGSDANGYRRGSYAGHSRPPGHSGHSTRKRTERSPHGRKFPVEDLRLRLGQRDSQREGGDNALSREHSAIENPSAVNRRESANANGTEQQHQQSVRERLGNDPNQGAQRETQKGGTPRREEAPSTRQPDRAVDRDEPSSKRLSHAGGSSAERLKGQEKMERDHDRRDRGHRDPNYRQGFERDRSRHRDEARFEGDHESGPRSSRKRERSPSPRKGSPARMGVNRDGNRHKDDLGRRRRWEGFDRHGRPKGGGESPAARRESFEPPSGSRGSARRPPHPRMPMWFNDALRQAVPSKMVFDDCLSLVASCGLERSIADSSSRDGEKVLRRVSNVFRGPPGDRHVVLAEVERILVHGFETRGRGERILRKAHSPRSWDRRNVADRTPSLSPSRTVPGRRGGDPEPPFYRDGDRDDDRDDCRRYADSNRRFDEHRDAPRRSSNAHERSEDSRKMKGGDYGSDSRRRREERREGFDDHADSENGDGKRQRRVYEQDEHFDRDHGSRHHRREPRENDSHFRSPRHDHFRRRRGERGFHDDRRGRDRWRLERDTEPMDHVDRGDSSRWRARRPDERHRERGGRFDQKGAREGPGHSVSPFTPSPANEEREIAGGVAADPQETVEQGVTGSIRRIEERLDLLKAKIEEGIEDDDQDGFSGLRLNDVGSLIEMFRQKALSYTKVWHGWLHTGGGKVQAVGYFVSPAGLEAESDDKSRKKFESVPSELDLGMWTSMKQARGTIGRHNDLMLLCPAGDALSVDDRSNAASFRMMVESLVLKERFAVATLDKGERLLYLMPPCDLTMAALDLMPDACELHCALLGTFVLPSEPISSTQK